MELLCREARPSEAPLIAEFQIEMAYESEKLKLNSRDCHLGVQTLFNHPHLGTYYVATLGDQVVACLLVIPEWSDWQNRMVWWIHSVYVLPEFRGQGIFKKLYETVKKIGIEQHRIRALRLYVDKKNVIAQKAYHRIGMRNDHYDLFEWDESNSR